MHNMLDQAAMATMHAHTHQLKLKIRNFSNPIRRQMYSDMHALGTLMRSIDKMSRITFCCLMRRWNAQICRIVSNDWDLSFFPRMSVKPILSINWLSCDISHCFARCVAFERCARRCGLGSFDAASALPSFFGALFMSDLVYCMWVSSILRRKILQNSVA